ncbi:MAG: hypothetical protein LBI61_01955 [Puniceicoccales bacterium]|jgi:uncharacterized protein YicC (UPF0701 family)|nr:hypothetical protein [Puniceicoccales bacterium]
MQIMKISMGTVVLVAGDSSNERAYDFKITNTRQIQIATAVRSATARGFDRGNQQTTVEFRVSKRHDSAQKAQKYVLQHAALLKNLSPTLTIAVEPSQEIYALSDAAIGDVQSESEGVVSLHFYKIIGGNFAKISL